MEKEIKDIKSVIITILITFSWFFIIFGILISSEISNLQTEIDHLEQKVQNLERNLDRHKFGGF